MTPHAHRAAHDDDRLRVRDVLALLVGLPIFLAILVLVLALGPVPVPA
jgi:hypothetical protein